MPETVTIGPPEAKLTEEDLSWLTPEEESPGKKMGRKVMANPFVPIGKNPLDHVIFT